MSTITDDDLLDRWRSASRVKCLDQYVRSVRHVRSHMGAPSLADAASSELAPAAVVDRWEKYGAQSNAVAAILNLINSVPDVVPPPMVERWAAIKDLNRTNPENAAAYAMAPALERGGLSSLNADEPDTATSSWHVGDAAPASDLLGGGDDDGGVLVNREALHCALDAVVADSEALLLAPLLEASAATPGGSRTARKNRRKRVNRRERRAHASGAVPPSEAAPVLAWDSARAADEAVRGAKAFVRSRAAGDALLPEVGLHGGLLRRQPR
jgi:hypothetical protein